jgi:UDP-glucuronate 4-epimerase
VRDFALLSSGEAALAEAGGMTDVANWTLPAQAHRRPSASPRETILVTGGAGFIGSHLCERLVALGHSVAAVDDFNASYDPLLKRRNIERLLDADTFFLVEGDTRDLPGLAETMRRLRPTVVVHLAARAGVRQSFSDPGLYVDVNVKGTLNVLETSIRAGVRKFIFASSSSVYGAAARSPFKEDTDTGEPISPYGATKRAGELLCHAYHHRHGLDVTCLRFFSVYGPRQRPDMALFRFVSRLARGRKIPMFGDGTTKRDYTFVSDIVTGIVRAIDGCRGFDVYNLGNSRSVELRTLIELAAKCLGRPVEIEELPLQPGDMKATCADISRARMELGYEPRVAIEDGVRAFVDWYLEESRTSGAPVSSSSSWLPGVERDQDDAEEERAEGKAAVTLHESASRRAKGIR